ncbi:class I SAM-dependent methyltransferase [Aeromonas veronii]|uniref:class I SAM-dependent methyltransferase n=1 Tax=Aeromonas veronii TaxID=654 RepID=UPI003D06573F
MQVIIYGTSSYALHFLPALALNFNIIGFVDSDPAKKGTIWMGKKTYHPSELGQLNFYFIVIASTFVKEINNTLRSYGLPEGITPTELPEVMQTFHLYENAIKKIRFDKEKKIPKSSLQQSHIKNAILIPNRESLLDILPKGGTAAEIGVAGGEFSKKILDINAPKSLHLIDVWSSERYGEPLYLEVKSKFQKEQRDGKVIIHRRESLDALQIFPDSFFDWIYIDTDHSYELTREELRLSASKIKPGGFIAGHDYQQGNWVAQYRYGVMEAVSDFCHESNWEIAMITMYMAEMKRFCLKKI